MFELEVNFCRQANNDNLETVIASFRENAAHLNDIEMFSLLQWEEHCTECAMPDCFQTCDLYVPRKDGKCRRFTNGIVPLEPDNTRVSPVVRIDFKRWGALMATNRLALAEVGRVNRVERGVRKIETIARVIPDGHLPVFGRRGLSSRLVTRYKNWLTDKFITREADDTEPTGFMIEVFNPDSAPADITFVIRAREGDRNRYPYQERLLLEPGYSRIVLEYRNIKPHINPSSEHFVSITPNLDTRSDVGITLYFGTLGLFRRKQDAVSENGKTMVKVVAWDLDNTLWDGILVEDGQDAITIKRGIEDIIKELDRRGIMNTVISKNNYDEAWNQIEKFGLAKYFLFPSINWMPKSKALGELVENFNVGENTIAFIDDSAFERAEVSTSYPQVRVIDASEYMEILGRPEFNPVVSVESSRRRGFYRNQGARASAFDSYSGEYLDFIKDSEIKLTIVHGHMDDLERIHELVQRTNQMNFSGNRYTKEQLQKILGDSNCDTYTLLSRDRFGDYGTIGFCVVDIEQSKMIDLAFSCRVQSKRIEHAFVGWLLAEYKKKGVACFCARYRQTDRNEPAGKVFSEMGFDAVSARDNIIEYQYCFKKDIDQEGLIEIVFKENS